MFYATNKSRHSTYLCTPSGKSKQRICVVLTRFVRSASFFPIPLKRSFIFYSSFLHLLQIFRSFSAHIAVQFLVFMRYYIDTANTKGGFIQLIEIIMTILAICLLVKAISLAFKITWNVAKIVATIMMILAVPVFIVCLIFAGGFILLIPVALIAGSIGILAKCA